MFTRGSTAISEPAKIKRFLEEHARPHVVEEDLERAFQDVARDEARGAEEREWVEWMLEGVCR